MKTMLFTQSFSGFRGDNAYPLRYAMANFFEQELSTKCRIELPGEQLNWLDFDFVFPSTTVFDFSRPYDTHYAEQLQLSVKAGQRRFADYDDVYFPPMSGMLQLGLDDTDEYTDAVLLHDQPFDREYVFATLTEFQSRSIAAAKRHVWPFWTCPTQLDGVAVADTSKLLRRALYTGHPKPDRFQIMSRYPSIVYSKCSYVQMLHECASSLASVMMNSPSHMGNATLRFYESAMLSVQLWPEGVYVNDYVPPTNRVFNNNDQLESILDELASQTTAQRTAELTAQGASVRSTLSLMKTKWRQVYDYTSY